MDLSEKSKAYYGNNDFYELFSLAEDYPQEIINTLKPLVSNKIILDAGCGTGKYIYNFKNNNNYITGIDASEEQIKIAKLKNNENSINFIVSDLCDINMSDSSVDLIYSSWVLGTITDENKRLMVLNELKRILKPNGEIYMIENDIGGRFEELRDRINNDKTKKYNDWLIFNDFLEFKRINTFFKFKDLDETFNVFNNIYGPQISKKIDSNIISHNVIIYKFTKRKEK